MLCLLPRIHRILNRNGRMQFCHLHKLQLVNDDENRIYEHVPLRIFPSTTRTRHTTPTYWSYHESNNSARNGLSRDPGGLKEV